MGGKGSGPPKYTQEVHDTIIEALNRGCFRVHACGNARVSVDAFTEWLKLGALGVEPYVKLAADVHHAESKHAHTMQTVITAAALGQSKGDWKAAAYNLEKKYPRLYGRIAELEQLREAEIRAAKKHLDKPYSPWKPPQDAPPPTTPPRRSYDS